MRINKETVVPTVLVVVGIAMVVLGIFDGVETRTATLEENRRELERDPATITIDRRDMGDATCFLSHHPNTSRISYRLSCVPK